jgi:outer membrane PBP1 activator LpoA protein
MLIKSLAGLVVAAALALLAGCSTPCGTPGGLCAPVTANTSAAHPAPAPVSRPAQPAEPAGPPIFQRTVPGVVHVALLLPIQSQTLGPAANAVRDGFMAAWERDRSGFEVEVVATGDAPQEVLDAYGRAAARNDVIVGPLARPAVERIAASGAVNKPTIVLNHPQATAAAPLRVLVAGLSIEDEARQVAQWAARDFPSGRAVILAGPAAWQQRLARAFDMNWTELGRMGRTVDLPVADGYVNATALADLRTQLEVGRPELIFAALDPDELRQLRSALGTAVPTYGTSAVNPGRGPEVAVPELNGVRLLDLPWLVLPDNPSVMVYPRRLATDQALDLDRLYALGIDAFRIAREVTLRPGAPFTLDGVTGMLTIDATTDTPALQRREAAVIYQDGAFQPVPDAP